MTLKLKLEIKKGKTKKIKHESRKGAVKGQGQSVWLVGEICQSSSRIPGEEQYCL